MKTYVLTTGLIFVLTIVAHIARMFDEGPHILRQPAFAFTSALSVTLAVWAWRVFRQISQPRE